MKICVLVKEVPDAAVEKRMDPNTKRLDRSGETTLNQFDTHAIEAAMQIREGGAADVDEIVAVTMGPDGTTTGFVRMIENYVRTNRRIYQLVRNRPHAVIHYEELVRHPEEKLRSLMQQLGLAFDRRCEPHLPN